MTSDHFDKIYCINLEKRIDRFEAVSEQFQEFGISPVQFIKAIDGRLLNPPKGLNGGQYGCILSHLIAIKHAQSNGYKRILIFEDDVQFEPFYNEHLTHIPDEYEMLYFGGSDKYASITPVNQWISKVEGMLCTHAYALNESVYDLIIALLSNANAPVDVMYQEIQKNINTFAFIPKIAFQREGFSDVINKKVRYKSTTNEPNPTQEW